jgi:hypothetical protein
MSARKDKGKRERYVSLRYWLLDSPAWKSLPVAAHALYIQIARRYNGSNNGRIPYSVREAVDVLRIGKSTVARLLVILQTRGFIVCTRKGAFSLKTTKDASEWRLTEYDSDAPVAHASKDFMRWQPPEDTDFDTLNQQPSRPRKFKTRVPQRDHTVPVVGPHGICGGTVKPKKRRNGTCGGTVKAKNAPSTVPPAGHLHIPGIGREPGVCVLPRLDPYTVITKDGVARGTLPEGEPAAKQPWSAPRVEEFPWDTLPTELRMTALGLPAPVPEPEIRPEAEFEELPSWKEWNAASSLWRGRRTRG